MLAFGGRRDLSPQITCELREQSKRSRASNGNESVLERRVAGALPSLNAFGWGGLPIRGWVKAMLLVAALALCLTAISGYRLRPISAAGVRGRVIRTVSFGDGAALLIRPETGGCHVALVRRFGPLWRSEGGAFCRWADESHPFRYAGWGRGGWSKDEPRSVLAIGGIFSDERITTIRMAGQAEQAVSPETGYLFVYEVIEFVAGYPPTQALTADGVILHSMHTGTGWEWAAPPAPPPLPERVTERVEVTGTAVVESITAERPLSSVWQNGEVQIDGQWRPFYVWADGRAGLCAVGTAIEGQWRPWYQAYPCPEPMGALRITEIDATGQIVSFVAPDGRTGRFDLAALTWHMDGE
jgi:hypothetical protein